MSTLRQIEANRRNALKSTGPTSPEGKAASRFNALQTGIHAQSQVIPGEDPAELQALADDYHRQFPPMTPLERFLVDALIHADWQLRRLRRLEAQLWTNQIKDNPDLGQGYTRSIDVFTRLQRRIDAAERSYYRALQQLQRQAVAPATEHPSMILAPPSSQSTEESAVSPELASFCGTPGAAPPDPAPGVLLEPLLAHHMR